MATNDTSVLKRAARMIAPPILPFAWRKLTSKSDERRLFRGYDSIFVERLQKTRVYGEYGCGESTIWVANQTDAQICAVDTSKQWIDHVKSQIKHSSTHQIKHIDLGELGEWGRPISYAMRDQFEDYTLAPWNCGQPDTVLVDGRFRVACFLTSLLKADPGTVVIFDDYVGRSHYHIVEEFVKPVELCGDQAAFVVPENLPIASVSDARAKFLYVMD